MLKNNKKLIYIVTAIIILIVIIISTVFIAKSINNNNKKQDATISETTADLLKTQAIDALKNNDNTKAKTLFLQAQQQYKDLGDTNNVVDTNAQIWLIENSNQ